MNKGVITTTLAGTIAGGTILVSIVASYFVGQLATYDRIADVNGKTIMNTANIVNIQGDVGEIKGDVKLLLREFNIKE